MTLMGLCGNSVSIDRVSWEGATRVVDVCFLDDEGGCRDASRLSMHVSSTRIRCLARFPPLRCVSRDLVMLCAILVVEAP